MPVIPINPDYSNISTFINSLFDADVRKPDAIKAVVKKGRFTGSFSSQNDKIRDLLDHAAIPVLAS